MASAKAVSASAVSIIKGAVLRVTCTIRPALCLRISVHCSASWSTSSCCDAGRSSCRHRRAARRRGRAEHRRVLVHGRSWPRVSRRPPIPGWCWLGVSRRCCCGSGRRSRSLRKPERFVQTMTGDVRRERAVRARHVAADRRVDAVHRAGGSEASRPPAAAGPAVAAGRRLVRWWSTCASCASAFEWPVGRRHPVLVVGRIFGSLVMFCVAVRQRAATPA